MAQRRAKFILFIAIRLILVASLALALFEGRKLLLFATSILLAITFLPTFVENVFKKRAGILLDAVIFIVIFGAMSYFEIRGVYSNFIILAGLMNLAKAIAVGLLGFSLVFSFFKYLKLEGNILAVSFFSFCFAFTIGTLLEMGEILADDFLGFRIHSSGAFGTAGDLGIYLAVAFVISSAGYISLKKGKRILVSTFFEDFIEKNHRFFGIKGALEEDCVADVSELIKKGEGNNLEFKSTLRKNLHTKSFDKQIEHAILKTINAYLNSDGGTLLIGVSDKGEILGIEPDEFEREEHANRHLNNIISTNLGAEFMPFVKAELIKIEDKTIIKVNCRKSDREAFLKHGNEEQFYIRRGSLSMPLSGSALLKYVESEFRKKD